MFLFLGMALSAGEITFFLSSGINLWGEWGRPEYSHCPLLFLFGLGWAGYLFKKRSPIISQSWGGACIFFIALLMNIFGSISANNWISEFSVIVSIGGLGLALSGVRSFLVMLPGLFLLIFTVPLPPIMLATLTAKMQLLSSSLSVAGLNLLTIPVFQEGNIIDLGTYKLQVAEACSGLRYLFPFMSFGYLFSMLFENNWCRRSLLIASTVPITIFMNALRIIFVGITVDLWGQEMAEGVLHDFEGWLVFVACIGLLIAENWVIGFVKFPSLSLPGWHAQVGSHPKSSAKMILMLLFLVIFGIVAEHRLGADEQEATTTRTPFAFFPLSIGDWVGHSELLPQDQISILKFSDYILANYHDPHLKNSVNFYAAYYASQRRNAAPHSPLVCIGGSGWEINQFDDGYEVRDKDDKPLLHVNRAVVTNGDARELVYFWFQERGRDLTTARDRKWFLFKDAVLRHRTDGALVRVVTPITDETDEHQADGELASFLVQVLPKLDQYIPN